MIYFIAPYKLKGTISIDDVSELPEFEGEFIGWDTETTGLCPFYDKPILSILGDSEHQIVIDLISTPLELIEAVHRKYSGKTWVAHNAKFDYKMFKYHFPSIVLPKLFDTMIASRIIYNGYKHVKHSLEYLTDKLLNIKLSKDIRLSFVGYDLSKKFTFRQIEYAADDVRVLLPLKEQLDLRINKFNYNKLIELENSVMPVLADMEVYGMSIDKVKWENNASKNKEELLPIITAIDLELVRLVKLFPNLRSYLFSLRFKKEETNYASNSFWLDVVEMTEGLAILEQRKDQDSVIEKRTKTLSKKVDKLTSLFDVDVTPITLTERQKYSLDKATIDLFLRSEYSLKSELRRLFELIIEYRKKSKEITTYGMDFIKNVNPVTGKLHTEYGQVMTSTGRLNSSKYKVSDKVKEGYNAQNIPKSKVLRSCFISDDPNNYEVLTADYSGQETILAASQSNDSKLLELAKEDLHSYLAQPSFRLIMNDPELIVTKEINSHLRNKHKSVLFGIFYGAKARRVASVLNIPLSIAEKVYESIKTLLPDFFKYQRRVQLFALKNRYITDNSKYGRRRWFTSEDKDHKIEKQASNYGMQSSGASMIKEALVKIEAYFCSLRATFPLLRILTTVHDEIVCQIPKNSPEIASRIIEIMKEVGNSFVTGITIDVEYKVADSWTK
jgi:DNA polymerase I-like protein with 3'-5' exonuclease and polymerase domains